MALRVNCYTDIEEMPIYNWFKVHSTGDLAHLLVKKRKTTNAEQPKLEEKWKLLYDQYIALFGFSKDYLELLEKRSEIALLMIEKAETGDRNINTFINFEKQKLELMEKKSSGGSNFYEIKTFVEKKMGFQIDIRRMSVVEFYTTLNSVNNGKQ